MVLTMNIDGSEIFVERLQGNGDLNFVLIHNAGGNHRFFTHQTETLKKYGDVIQLDLPGHGVSERQHDNTMDGLTTIVSKVCKHLSLKNICLIGLNNGADIVINTMSLHTLPIHSIILIDPPIFMDKKFIGEINGFIEQLEGPDYSQFVRSLVDNLFIDTKDSNKDIATKAFMTVDKNSLQAMFRGLIKWDRLSANMVKTINCPTLCILTDEHHCTYDRLSREAPQFEIGKVIGSKCWATLEVPEQVNAMIERFLKIHI